MSSTAWGATPATWTTGQVVTATQLNTEIRDRMNYLVPLVGSYTGDDTSGRQISTGFKCGFVHIVIQGREYDSWNLLGTSTMAGEAHFVPTATSTNAHGGDVYTHLHSTNGFVVDGLIALPMQFPSNSSANFYYYYAVPSGT